MKVSEIMTRDVCIARPDQTIEDVARMMLAIDAGLLPVGDDGRLVGTITDRDIAVRAVAEGKGPQHTGERGDERRRQILLRRRGYRPRRPEHG